MIPTRFCSTTIVLVALSAATGLAAAPGLVVGDMVEITDEDVVVKVGRHVVGTVDIAERYEVLALEREWVRVEIEEKAGWVPRAKVERVPPIEMGDLIVVTAETATAMLGEKVVATVRTGDEFIVLESREPWLRIRVDDEAAWVRISDTRLVTKSLKELLKDMDERTFERAGAHLFEKPTAAADLSKRIAKEAYDGLQLIERQSTAAHALQGQLGERAYTEAATLANGLRGTLYEPQHVIRMHRRMLSLVKRVKGAHHWRTTDTRIGWRTAIHLATLSEEQRGRMDLAYERNRILLQLHAEGRTREAILLADDIRTTVGELLGEEHTEYGSILTSLGFLHSESGLHSEALTFYERALEIDLDNLGEEHPSSALTLHNLAHVHENLQDYVKAQSLFERSLDIRRRTLGEGHPDIALSLNDLASLYKARLAYTKALPLYERALEVQRESIPEQHPDHSRVLENLADLYFKMGDYTAAQPLLERALEIRSAVHGEEHPQYVGTLNNLAAVHQSLGQHETARSQYERVVEIYRKSLGKEHADFAVSLSNLGAMHMLQADYTEAEQLIERALEIQRNVLGENDPKCAATLINLGRLHQELGALSKAESHYRYALEIRRRTVGEEHPDYAIALHYVAVLHSERGEYDESLRLHERVLAIRRNTQGIEHPDCASVLCHIGSLHETRGRYVEARKLYRQSLDIIGRTLGEEHPEMCTVLSSLGRVQNLLGHFDEARSFFERAIAIRRKVFGDAHPQFGASLRDLAMLHESRYAYDEAFPLLARALEIDRRVLGDQHPGHATGLVLLARNHVNRGEYARARPLYEEAISVLVEAYGEEHSKHAVTLASLASLQAREGAFAKARETYKRAIEIQRKVVGRNHPDYAVSLSGLARVLQGKGDSAAEAQDLYEQALEIRLETLGPEHPAYASSLNNLGTIHTDRGELDSAKSLFERALAIESRALGEHGAIAPMLNNLADVHCRLGEFAEGRRLLERAIVITHEKRGPEHPDHARVLANLATLHVETREWQDAATAYDRNRRVVRRYLGHVLPGLSPEKQIRFIRVNDDDQFHAALALALRDTANVDVKHRTASWLLNGKAAVTESLAWSQLLTRELEDPRNASLAEELATKRAHLARESLLGVDAEQLDEHHARLEELQNRIDAIIRQLGALGLGHSAIEPWIELDTLRDSIPEGSVLVDIVRIKENVRRGPNKDRYERTPLLVAWIVPAKGEVQVVDLGEAEVIESLVEATRRAINEGRRAARDDGEAEAEKAVMVALRELAAATLHPVLAELGDDVDRLILSPDGALWLAPWAALPLEDGRYAVERYEIGYVVSGRDLVARRFHEPGTGAAILADPDFECDPEFVRETEIEDHQTVEDSQGGIPRANRLPATAAEARAIAPAVRELVGTNAFLHLGGDATEERFKALDRPRVVTIATHGFFLKDQLVERKGDRFSRLGDQNRSAVLTTEGSPLENPLLRCGLLLAGANQRHRAADDVDDGILTGVEIVGTDLRGTELVVLSACETGVGEVRNGEGVAGLRQAFQLAGAESVVASLWQVDDLATARLMRDFFGNLAEPGTRRTAALRKAQLARIESRRDRYGAAHPFYWAAFTLTGSSGGE